LLLADDSVTIQRVIELTFADEDIAVIAVSDGDQAIERLKAAPPDIVLADIGMPGKNGYEVAQYIRQTPNLSHIPVMLLTGAFEPVDQARAAEAGCDGVLAKPFEPQMVIGRVRDLLAKGRGGAVHAQAAAPAPPPFRPVEQWLPPANQTLMTSAPAAARAGEPAELDDYFDRLDAAFSSMSAPKTSAAPPPQPPPNISRPRVAESPVAPPEIDWFSSAPAPGASAEPWDLPSPGPAPAAARDLPLSLASAPPEAPPFSSSRHVAAAPARAEASAPHVADADAETIFMPAARDTAAHAAPAIAAAPAAAPPPAAAVEVTPPAAPTEMAPAVPPPHATLPSVAATELPSLGDAFAALLAAELHDGSASEAPGWPGTKVAAPAPAITDALIDDVVRRVLERMSDQVVRATTADLVSGIAERLVSEEIEKIRASIK
jgi:CheY-like chemotaxis protein